MLNKGRGLIWDWVGMVVMMAFGDLVKWSEQSVHRLSLVQGVSDV